jgi:hypothetical protein
MRLVGAVALAALLAGCGESGGAGSASTSSASRGSATTPAESTTTTTGIAIGSPEARALAEKYLISKADVAKLGVETPAETGFLAGGSWWSTCKEGLSNDGEIRQRGQTVWDHDGIKAFHAAVVYSTPEAAKAAVAEAQKLVGSCTTFTVQKTTYSGVEVEHMKKLTGAEDQLAWCQQGREDTTFHVCHGVVRKGNIVSSVWASSSERPKAAVAAGVVLGVATAKLRR